MTSNSSGKIVTGVDGCKAGWLAAQLFQSANGDTRIVSTVCSTFADVIEVTGTSECVVVDMPIGLLDVRVPGGRPCDREARRILGQPRGSSVFPPPARSILNAQDYEEVRKKGLSKQAFGILPKIREVDLLFSQELQARVVESHPELAFSALAGQPLLEPKKKKAGRERRLDLLEQVLPGIRSTYERERSVFLRSSVADDDLVDACVMAWVALKKSRNLADCLAARERDSQGLEMTMWY